MPLTTVNAVLPRKEYTASAGQTVFTVPFEFLADVDLKVYQVPDGVTPDDTTHILTLTTHYTVVGAGVSDPGTREITLVTGATLDDTIIIQGEADIDRDTAFLSVGDLTIASINEELNKLILLNKQLSMLIENKTLQFIDSSILNGVDMSMPAPEANKSLTWNATADALVNAAQLDTSSVVVTAFMETLLDDSSASAARDTLQLRDTLQSARTYYVRVDGNDSNDGLTDSAGGAFLTLQKAVDVVMDEVDLNGYDLTIKVGDGTYTAGAIIAGPWTGEGTVTFEGNTATPANCIVSATSSDCFFAKNYARIDIKGFKVTTTTSGNCITSWLSSIVNYGFMDFGASANMHVEAGQHSYVGTLGDYSITGGAVGHWHGGGPGLINIGTVTITITGTPAFSAYFAGVAEGSLYCKTAVFSGSATGERFLAHKGGLIDTGDNSLTYFPGDVAGEVNTLGVYYGKATPIYLQPINKNPEDLVIRSRRFDTQTYEERLKVTCEPLGGHGYIYIDGDDSYLSGLTHLSGDSEVIASSGSADGVTFKKKSDVAANSQLFHMSANENGCGNFRRRSTDGVVLTFYRDTTAVGSISVTTTNTAYNVSSDYRLKQNIKPVMGAWDRLKQYNPVTFEFKSDPDKKCSGFIAHELEGVCPQAVTGEKDAVDDDNNPVYQQVDQSKIIADLTAALKEAMSRIEALENSKGI